MNGDGHEPDTAHDQHGQQPEDGWDDFPIERAARPGPAGDGRQHAVWAYDAYNRKDEDLVDIKEIMLDIRTGRVGYAVLSFDGFLNMGEKLFAVPWEALTLDIDNKRFVLDIEKNQLENAPGFDKDSERTRPDLSQASA